MGNQVLTKTIRMHSSPPENIHMGTVHKKRIGPWAIRITQDLEEQWKESLGKNLKYIFSQKQGNRALHEGEEKYHWIVHWKSVVTFTGLFSLHQGVEGSLEEVSQGWKVWKWEKLVKLHLCKAWKRERK